MTAQPGTIQERFEQFHKDNPHVFTELVALAEGLRARGRAKVGIGMLFEVLRWQSYMTTRGDDFKLNNDYRSRYARLIAEQRPELADLFETRLLTAA